jgi:hypothetical protein
VTVSKSGSGIIVEGERGSGSRSESERGSGSGSGNGSGSSVQGAVAVHGGMGAHQIYWFLACPPTTHPSCACVLKYIIYET